MKTCATCACSWVCDRDYNKTETCGNWISKWISVEDKLPPENVEVIAAYDNGKVNMDFFLAGRWAFTYYGTVTHWMLKPEHPEEKSHEENQS